MEFYIVDEVWQLALVYQVRLNYSLRGYDDLDLPESDQPKQPGDSLRGEFNEEYGVNYTYALLADDDVGLATCRIHPLDEETCKIERVAVREDCQGQGLGSKLMACTEEKIKEKGYKTIVIYSYAGALDFYLQNGYVIDENVIIDHPVPQVCVKKEL